MSGAFWWDRKRVKIAFESKQVTVLQRDDRVKLEQYGPWTDQCARLADEYKITDLTISETRSAEWESLDFLRTLPALEALHIVLALPKDLSPVIALSGLKSLGIRGAVCATKSPIPELDFRADGTVMLGRPQPYAAIEVPVVDFTALAHLTYANFDLCEATQSLFRCSTLQALWVWDERQQKLQNFEAGSLPRLQELQLGQCPKLKDVDLSHQPELCELRLLQCPKLRSVRLHAEARLRSLEVGQCGPYRIDWDRLGPDLETLELHGPLRFPFEDVRKAPNLRRLRTNGIRKFPPLKFLLDLPQLEEFSIFHTPGGPKMPEEDDAVIREIFRRGKIAAARVEAT